MEQAKLGFLKSRPGIPSDDGRTGVHGIQAPGCAKEALLLVPSRYHRTRPAPLAVMLHGAGGSPEHGLELLRAHSEEHGLILLAASPTGNCSRT